MTDLTIRFNDSGSYGTMLIYGQSFRQPMTQADLKKILKLCHKSFETENHIRTIAENIRDAVKYWKKDLKENPENSWMGYTQKQRQGFIQRLIKLNGILVKKYGVESIEEDAE